MKEMLRKLAETYPQLNIAPGPGGTEKYRDAVLRGIRPPEDLSHFTGSDRDCCTLEHTPAGDVWAVTLGKRKDFETFLKIMCWRCEDVEIPETQGAVHVSGIINRGKVDDFIAGWHAAHPDPAPGEWQAAFQAFQADKAAYTETLIILSTGPYSAVPAAEAGLSEAEWLEKSLTIRKTHECTHYLCRRLYPEQKEAVWDELVADAAGLFAAFGRYDPQLAERVLGIRDGEWIGGRLSIYTETPEALARRIHGLLPRFAEAAAGAADAYSLAEALEKRQAEWSGAIHVEISEGL